VALWTAILSLQDVPDGGHVLCVCANDPRIHRRTVRGNLSSSAGAGSLDARARRQNPSRALDRRVAVSATVSTAHAHLLLPRRPTPLGRPTAARLTRLQHSAFVDDADEVRGAGVDAAVVRRSNVRHDRAVRVHRCGAAASLQREGAVHQRSRRRGRTTTARRTTKWRHTVEQSTRHDNDDRRPSTTVAADEHPSVSQLATNGRPHLGSVQLILRHLNFICRCPRRASLRRICAVAFIYRFVAVRKALLAKPAAAALTKAPDKRIRRSSVALAAVNCDKRQLRQFAD